MDTLQSLIEKVLTERRSRGLFWMTLFVIFYLAFAPHVNVGPDFDQVDKLKHALAFAVLTILLQRGYRFASLATIFILLDIGLFIESVQWFLPYRDASLWDMLADGAGIALGLRLLMK